MRSIYKDEYLDQVWFEGYMDAIDVFENVLEGITKENLGDKNLRRAIQKMIQKARDIANKAMRDIIMVEEHEEERILN